MRAVSEGKNVRKKYHSGPAPRHCGKNVFGDLLRLGLRLGDHGHWSV